MSIQITPTSAALGAYVRGLDVDSMTPQEEDALRQAFTDYGLLIFKDVGRAAAPGGAGMREGQAMLRQEGLGAVTRAGATPLHLGGVQIGGVGEVIPAHGKGIGLCPSRHGMQTDWGRCEYDVLRTGVTSCGQGLRTGASG